MGWYDIASGLAGLLVTVGMVGLAYVLVTNKVTSIRRPLAILALIESICLNVLYFNYLSFLFWGFRVFPINSRLLTVVAFLVLGNLLALKPYVDLVEYRRTQRIRDHIEKDS